VFITDTGNKRVVIFTANGDFVTQFGTSGIDMGQFDEPVGLAVDSSERVYVNDTWNQRVQVFTVGADNITYQPFKEWSVNGWFGQSLDNKPFINLDSAGNVYITDPEGYRVLEFDPNGVFMRGWGDYSTDSDGFGLASGVAIDADGTVWVTDGGNNRFLSFKLP
jgi:sugar lactone lactonase YvrE